MGALVSLAPATLVPDTDGRVSGDIHVRNTGGARATFRLQVGGLPGEWARFNPGALTLEPGATGVARVAFRVPRSTAAGPVPFTVSARAGQDPGASPAEGILEVPPFCDLAASLGPPGTRRERVDHILTVENRGNTEAVVSVTAVVDAEAPVEVSVELEQLVLGAGATGTVMVTARPAVGRRGTASVSVVVRVEADGAPPASLRADVAFAAARRPHWLARAAAVLAVVAVAGAVARATVLAPEDATPAGTEATGPRRAQAGPGCTTSGHLRVEGQPPPANYAFLFPRADGCEPVRVNPCQPVHYVLNAALASPADVADAREALRRLAEATGLAFVDDGATDEVATVERSAFQPDRYGRRWAPVLISWARLGREQGDVVVAGKGQPQVVDDVIVSGALELNLDAVSDAQSRTPLPNGFGAGITWGRVMLHELGHVLGLSHVGNRAQLMHDELSRHTAPTADFGEGDLTGLRLVGREAGCLPPPPVPA